MAITPLPDPPSRADPSTFAEKGDAFIAAMVTFQQELNEAASAYGLSLGATSATELTIGTGSKTLTVQTGKGFVPGVDVFIADAAAPATNRMYGTVTAYDTNTGELTVAVDSVEGSGTISDWKISLAVIANFDGQTFTNLVLAGKVSEAWYDLSGTEINPANGTQQRKTLSAPTTFTETLADGEHVLLKITPAANAITWPTITWVDNGGAAPDWASVITGWVVLWKEGGALYGAERGQVA